MAFLASLLAYLGSAMALVAVLLACLNAVLANPDRPAGTQQAIAAVSSPSKPTAAASATAPATSRLGQWGPRVGSSVAETAALPQIKQINAAAAIRRKTHLAKAISPQQYFARMARQDRPNNWSGQQEPNFETRYLGYVDDPAADRSRSW